MKKRTLSIIIAVLSTFLFISTLYADDFFMQVEETDINVVENQVDVENDVLSETEESESIIFYEENIYTETESNVEKNDVIEETNENDSGNNVDKEEDNTSENQQLPTETTENSVIYEDSETFFDNTPAQDKPETDVIDNEEETQELSTEDCYNEIIESEPESVSVKGKITWNDDDNKDENRPTTMIVKLYADGKKIKEFEVSDKNGWEFEFSDLPKYVDGNEIMYMVAEELIDDYQPVYDVYSITNVYNPIKSDTDKKEEKLSENKEDEYNNFSEVQENIITSATEDSKNNNLENVKFAEVKKIEYSLSDVTNNNTKSIKNNPLTGDNTNITLMLMLMLFASVTIIGLTYKKK